MIKGRLRTGGNAYCGECKDWGSRTKLRAKNADNIIVYVTVPEEVVGVSVGTDSDMAIGFNRVVN